MYESGCAFSKLLHEVPVSLRSHQCDFMGVRFREDLHQQMVLASKGEASADIDKDAVACSALPPAFAHAQPVQMEPSGKRFLVVERGQVHMPKHVLFAIHERSGVSAILAEAEVRVFAVWKACFPLVKLGTKGRD